MNPDETRDVESVTELAERAYRHVKEGIMITDEKLHILSVNDSFTEFTGYQAEESFGQDICFFSLQIDKHTFCGNLLETIDQQGYWQGDIWGLRKNGDIYCVHLKVSSITDHNGRITNYVGCFHDISEKEKLYSDVIKAGELQRHSLPLPLKDSRFKTAAIYQPKRYVSGDLYDYFLSENKQKLTGFVMDFMGHGLSTALQASGVRVLFHQMIGLNVPLSQGVAWLNKESLKYFNDETFAAAIFFEFNWRNRSLTVTAAGINYLFCRTRELEPFVKINGSFLGIRESGSFEQVTLPLHQGDYFLFLSDGFLDTISPTFTEEHPNFQDAIHALQQTLPMLKGKDDCTAVGFHIED